MTNARKREERFLWSSLPTTPRAKEGESKTKASTARSKSMDLHRFLIVEEQIGKSTVKDPPCAKHKGRKKKYTTKLSGRKTKTPSQIATSCQKTPGQNLFTPSPGRVGRKKPTSGWGGGSHPCQVVTWVAANRHESRPFASWRKAKKQRKTLLKTKREQNYMSIRMDMC